MEAGFNHKNTDNMEKDQIIYDKRKAMGESIRAMRTAQGWEQEQLAQIAGITAANVRSIEYRCAQQDCRSPERRIEIN